MKFKALILPIITIIFFASNSNAAVINIFAGQTETISSSYITNQGQAIVSSSGSDELNRAALNVDNDISFENNNWSDQYVQGGVISAWSYSDIKLGNSIVFLNNNVSAPEKVLGGVILGDNINFRSGDGIDFKNNTADSDTEYTAGGIAWFRYSDIEFGNNINFIENVATSSNGYVSGGVLSFQNSSTTFGNNITFSENVSKSTTSDVYGGIFYSLSSTVVFGNDITFFNNSIEHAQSVEGGVVAGFSSNLTFGDRVIFDKNHIVAQSDIYGGFVDAYNSNTTFGNDITFKNNISDTSGKIAGGLMQGYNDSADIKTSTFGNNIIFLNNKVTAEGVIYGGALRAYQQGYSFGDNVVFKNNIANSGNLVLGGVILSELSTLTFAGNTSFIGNSSSSAGSNHATIYLEDSVINFSPTTLGQKVLFENNTISSISYTDKLNSIYFEDAGSVANFNMIAGTIADVRDSISSNQNYDNYGIVNKNGLGDMYLWGDNSEFTGTLNIKSGNFALMFDDADVWTQRHYNNTNISNATINFADGTVYRPMVNSTQLADLKNPTKLNVTGTVELIPYEISKLDVTSTGYTYAVDTTRFAGWDSVLAKVTTGATTTIEYIKDLAGYNGLSVAADAMRQDSLNYAKRDLFDDLYRTGVVTQEVLDLFKVIEGEDQINYSQVHRANVRQFSRQVNSRVNNKNCPECGVVASNKDEHMWFDVSRNQIKKDSSSRNAGYEYNPNGFAMGYDYDFIPQKLTAGVALSYGYGDIKNKTGSGIYSKDKLDEYMLSFYGKYKVIRPYVSWNVGGGLIENKTKLATAASNANGKYNTYAYFANLEAGYNFGNACGVLEPYIGAELTHLFSESYSEKGLGARHFDSMDLNVFEVPVGIRMSRDTYTKNYIFTPSVDVAYARNFGDKSAKGRASFVGNPGNTWGISSASDARDSYRGNLNFKINSLNEPFALNLGYAIDYRSDYTDQQIYGTVRYDF